MSSNVPTDWARRGASEGHAGVENLPGAEIEGARPTALATLKAHLARTAVEDVHVTELERIAHEHRHQIRTGEARAGARQHVDDDDLIRSLHHRWRSIRFRQRIALCVALRILVNRSGMALGSGKHGAGAIENALFARGW
jgi:hypothetical protein